MAVRFAKMIKGLPMPFSQLFKFEGEYFMSMDLSGYDEHELEKMSVIADEYADDIIAGGLRPKGLFLWSMQRLFLMIRLLRVLRSCEGTEQLQKKYNKTRSVSYTDRPCFICKYYPSTFLIDSITRSA